MNSQLDDLMKWSEGLTQSVWESASRMLTGWQAPAGSAPADSAGDILNRLNQLNQLTLSVIEQYRQWEKMNTFLKKYTEGLLGGVSLNPDPRVKELETQIETLQARLDQQEQLLRELQSKLQADAVTPADMNQTSKILSEFLARQTRQFQKLVQPEP